MYRIHGRLQSMAALGNLAVWLHAQILEERAFGLPSCWMKSRMALWKLEK